MPVQNLPPHDIDTEVSCLASIIVSKDALLKVLGILQSEDFYLEPHRLIFDAVRELDRKAKPVDLISLRHQLVELQKLDRAGGEAYLAKLYQSVATSANAEYYANQIKEYSLRRRLIETSGAVIESCYDISRETSEVLDDAEKMVFQVTERRISTQVQSIQQIVGDAVTRIERLIENKKGVTGLACGYSELDNMLTGFHPSELIIMAARPAMGKTALALNMMVNVAVREKRPVFFFSLEMPSVQLLMRLISIEAMIELQKLRTGFLNNDELRRIYAVADKFSACPMIIDDTPGLTITEIRAKARRASQKERLGIIIIDYLQLITTTTKGERHQQIGEISRGLKLLARELLSHVLIRFRSFRT
jgi:replicative DNA helicase